MPGIKVPLPIIPDLDVAGEIVEIGPGVDGWKTGDRVLVNPLHPQKGLMGEMLDGGMAAYCLASTRRSSQSASRRRARQPDLHGQRGTRSGDRGRSGTIT